MPKCLSGIEPLVGSVHQEFLHEVEEGFVLRVLLEYVLLQGEEKGGEEGRGRGSKVNLLAIIICKSTHVTLFTSTHTRTHTDTHLQLETVLADVLGVNALILPVQLA